MIADFQATIVHFDSQIDAIARGQTMESADHVQARTFGPERLKQ
jgi:hypothetical protein